MNVKDWRMQRIANNIKLKDVAKAIGISDSYLCKFEKGQVKLNPFLVKKYQDYIREHSNDEN
jgi:predicted transcriptional regulator